ncbi:mitochondrial 54S ribosomal protein YmL31 [Pisolithus marmoratus]|nr:mitochondrial 54S ribosomal protein YmL31 [Pisolithus marmoratus]
MLGAFRPTSVSSGGLLWYLPWKLSPTRKANARTRLKRVDAVIEAVRESGIQCNALVCSALSRFSLTYTWFICRQDRALQLPKEHEMHPRDKYTIFSAASRGYRKGIHKVPKWTRLTLRVNPKGF